MSFLSQLQLSAANAKLILVPGSECETLHWFRLCDALNYRGKGGIKTSNPITVAPELMAFHVPQASLAHIPSGSHHWATAILWPASLRTLQACTDAWVCVLGFTLSLTSLITLHPPTHANKHLWQWFNFKKTYQEIKSWYQAWDKTECDFVRARAPSVWPF